jgi:hypothetical protein
MVYLLSIVLSMLLWWANLADVAAAGNTYYASPRGSDSNPCSQSSPCSLGTGIARLQAGGTLILQGGTYSNPPLVIPTSASGSAGAHTRMRVSDGATVILYGDINLGDDLHDFTIDGLNGTLILDGQQTGGGIYTARASNMRFEQFEIRWTVMGFQGGFTTLSSSACTSIILGLMKTAPCRSGAGMVLHGKKAERGQTSPSIPVHMWGVNRILFGIWVFDE